jgi:hypothetical protein
MKGFEEELKKALARQSPQRDFSGRVLAAIEQKEVKPQTGSWRGWLGRTRNWRLAPILATFLLVTSAGAIYWRHERTVRGEAAKEKLLVAMHIAGSELQHARRQVFQIQGTEAEQ